MKSLSRSIAFMFLLTIASCSPIKNLYNNFSDFKLHHEMQGEKNKTVRIFLDRWGDVYPDIAIEKKLFRDQYSVLEDYFRYLGNLEQLYNRYHFPYNPPANDQDYKYKFNYVQDYLRSTLADSINILAENKKLVFLIHGYNNDPDSASKAFSTLRDKIASQDLDEQFQFVELYWDGLKDLDKLPNSSKIWDNAQVSASWAGIGLRGVLNKISKHNIYVFTHSHGAAVITEALFNVKRFPDKYYKKHKDGKELVTFQQLIETPQSNFVVGMIAPAIPGENVFKNYWERTGEEQTQKSNQKNYVFINGFNANDRVVLKPLKLTKYFGSTTFACNREENDKVRRFFSSTPELYDIVDFSGDKQTSHRFIDYMNNTEFPQLLIKVLSD